MPSLLHRADSPPPVPPLPDGIETTALPPIPSPKLLPQSSPPTSPPSKSPYITTTTTTAEMPAPIQRTQTKRQRFIRAITNPDTMFSSTDAPPSRLTESRLASSKLARSMFGTKHDPAPPNPMHLHVRTKSTSSDVSMQEFRGDAPLFDDKLISPYVILELPPGYEARPLRKDDWDNGYLDVLRCQGKVGRVTQAMWDERFEFMRRCRETYYIVVMCDGSGRVVAGGTCLVERKFLNGLGLVAHFEDIAVARDQKGKRMGLRILESLVYLAKELGCVNAVVNCSEANENFHAQCGFSREGAMMIKALTSKPPTLPA